MITVDGLRDMLLPIDFGDLAKIDRVLSQFATEIDALTSERNHALAEVMRLRGLVSEMDQLRKEVRLLKGQDDFIGDATDRQSFRAARTTIERVLSRARNQS